MTRVLVVDGTGLMVRCNRAGRNRALVHNGQRTGPLLMFISSLARQVRERSPQHVFVCWDGHGSLHWRRTLHPGYKASRALPPASGEMELAEEFCAAAGFRQLCLPGFEGDDAIAMAVDWVARDLVAGTMTTILSDDADLHQLLSWNVLQAPLTGSIAAAVDGPWAMRHYGCSGERIAMLRALAGDPSDGIPGLPGVGPKKALRMLQDASWQWPPPQLPPEDRRQVSRYLDILDPRRHPQWHQTFRLQTEDYPLNAANSWKRPPVAQVVPFLERYALSSLISRLEKGELW